MFPAHPESTINPLTIWGFSKLALAGPFLFSPETSWEDTLRQPRITETCRHPEGVKVVWLRLTNSWLLKIAIEIVDFILGMIFWLVVSNMTFIFHFIYGIPSY